MNYYELLGVKSNASLDEIKNAFFEKSKKVRSWFPSICFTFKKNVSPEEGSIVLLLL